jgi:hypothetical protein
MVVGVVNTTPRPLCLRERPGTHCIGGRVRFSDDLVGCGKHSLHRSSIPGPSSPERVAIPTELSRLPKKRLIPYKFEARYLCAWLISRNKLFPQCSSNLLWTLSRYPQSTWDHRLTCINKSFGSCLLAADRIQMLLGIGVDVWLQYFMPYSISANVNFIQLPRCWSLFWHCERKWVL